MQDTTTTTATTPDTVEADTDMSSSLSTLITSIKSSIAVQTAYANDLRKVEAPSKEVLRSIHEADKTIKINTAFLLQAEIVEAKAFSLKPVSNYFANAPKKLSNLTKYPERYTVELNKALHRLGRHKEIKFHHPDHISEVCKLFGIEPALETKFLGVISLFITSVSIRTNGMYIRYILSYFGNIIKAQATCNLIAEYNATAWPNSITPERRTELESQVVQAHTYIETQKEVLRDELTTLITELAL